MKKQFHYTACGLDNVWLENGYTLKETPIGQAVSVQDVNGLHELLALQLAQKPGLLTGKEFRFLRVQLGLSQEALGRLLDFSENAVSLWERKDTVPVTCDHWLRMCVLAKLAGHTKVADALERIKTVHKLAYQKYVVKDIQGRRTVSVVPMPAARQKPALA
jgi:DNA-binding transcriptional regulator YiaG